MMLHSVKSFTWFTSQRKNVIHKVELEFELKLNTIYLVELHSKSETVWDYQSFINNKVHTERVLVNVETWITW